MTPHNITFIILIVLLIIVILYPTKKKENLTNKKYFYPKGHKHHMNVRKDFLTRTHDLAKYIILSK